MSTWDWKSKPSELGSSHAFNGVNHQKSQIAAANSHKATPIVFDNTPKHLPPKFVRDVLRSGGDLGKKK